MHFLTIITCADQTKIEIINNTMQFSMIRYFYFDEVLKRLEVLNDCINILLVQLIIIVHHLQ